MLIDIIGKNINEYSDRDAFVQQSNQRLISHYDQQFGYPNNQFVVINSSKFDQNVSESAHLETQRTDSDHCNFDSDTDIPLSKMILIS